MYVQPLMQGTKVYYICAVTDQKIVGVVLSKEEADKAARKIWKDVNPYDRFSHKDLPIFCTWSDTDQIGWMPLGELTILSKQRNLPQWF